MEREIKKYIQNIDEIQYKNIEGDLPSDDIFEEMVPSENKTKLKTLKSPIYYLFDGYINKKIGSNYDQFIALIIKYNIHTYLIMNNDLITRIPNPTHATLIYNYNNYLIYSNSGLGINNQ